MKCPICNGEMVETQVPFPVVIGSKKAEARIYSHVCFNCGYDENDRRNKKIIANSINETLTLCGHSILEEWKEKNKSFSEIERSFLLPARTLSKWFNMQTKPSASASQLLRIINAFPWMEKVVDLGIESEEAQSYVRNYYVSEFNDSNKKIYYRATSDEHIYTAVIKKEEVALTKTYIPGYKQTGYFTLQ